MNTLLQPSRYPNFLVHAAGWLLLAGYELSYLYHRSRHLEPASVYVVYYAINVSFFYVTVALISRYFRLQQHRWLAFFLTWAGALALFWLLKISADQWFYPSQLGYQMQLTHLLAYLPAALYRLLAFAQLAGLYWLAGHLAAYRQQALLAERAQLLVRQEKLEVENQFFAIQNAYLRQQINPHLWLNVLNLIYSRIHRLSTEGAHCLLLLSDLMRFSLEHADPQAQCLLADEIMHIHQLVELNRYRYDFPLQLTLKAEGDFQQVRIIPMILLTLTENVFKHGIFKQPIEAAYIHLRLDSARLLTFQTFNYKKSRYPSSQTAPMGLANVRQRLLHTYGDQHTLAIQDTGLTFTLTLTIAL